jgi:deoxyadenosine/deoxycytidine kinase
MLEKFYNDQDKYSFPFQMMAYISRLALLKEAIKNNPEPDTVIITERCLYTDKYVFAKMLYDQGMIEEVEYQIYLQWFDEFATDFPVNHCIYLKADPSTCYERINKRSRSGEEVISIDYLESCHSYHNVYVEQMSKKLELDGNKDIYEEPEILNEWIQKIDELN